MADFKKLGKGVTGALSQAKQLAAAEKAMSNAAESAGMKAPVTANKPLTTMQDFHTSFGDSVRKRAMDMQATMDSFDYKYDKGQRVFTEDSARKNFPPMTVLGRVLEGNRIMREDPSDFLSKKIIDEATGKAKRTPHEPGYKVRLEHSPDNWSEFVIPESAIKGNVDMARGGFMRKADGGKITRGAMGALKKATEMAKAQKAAPNIIIPSKINSVKEAIRQSKGEYGARRVERAADEIPNLERLYKEQALKEAFGGDNARALMTMNPKDFEKYAVPLQPRFMDKNSTRYTSSGERLDYPEYMSGYLPNVGAFNDVPFLLINKEEQGLPLVPFISGHEGRHRNRVMADKGEETGLVQLLPRAELREPFPRRSQQEYIEALKEELAMTNNMVLPEKFMDDFSDKTIRRPAIKLPDIYAEGGGVKHMADAGRVSRGVTGALTKAKQMAQAKKSANADQPGVQYADPLQPATMRMSEALGNAGAEGKTLNFTEADRSRVFAKNLGGVGFSGLQHYSLPHKKANTVWGFGNKATAEKKIRQNDPENSLFTTFVGSPDQHKSNSVVIGDAMQNFQDAVKKGVVPPEQIMLMNKRLNELADPKTGAKIFEDGFDLTDPAALSAADTFTRRAAVGDVMLGLGVKGPMTRVDFKKEFPGTKFVDGSNIENILRRETDPDLVDAGTYDVGNRLFVMDGKIIQRPDLNEAFPVQVTGTDLGMKYQLVPPDKAMRDFYKAREGRKDKNDKPSPVTYYDLARAEPLQFVDEDYLTFLQKEGYKKGGTVNREESPEDMARFQKRFAMHKAIGGKVKKMASGGRASIFDKPVHMVDGGKIGKGVMGAVNKASRMADEKIAADAMKKAAESAGMKAPVTANKPLTNLQDFHTSLGDRIRQGAVETQNMIESMPFKYDKGQRVFTDDSAKKNRAPYEILMRTRYGNQVMREDHPTLGPNMGQTIRDPETGKAKRTPYEPGYRVRGEIGEMILPESAIKGDVEMARGGLAMAEGGNVLKGNILAGASWNSLNKTLGNELTTLTGQPTINTSVGGATTADTYKQLMDFINGGGSFDPNATVFLQTGGVDFITGVPREEVKSNIEQIISVLGDQGVNVVLTGAPYAASMDDVINNNFDPRIDPLFEEIAAAHPNVALVESMGDILQDKSLLSDAIHPNESGTRRYNDDVMGALTTLQQRESQGQEGREAATSNPQEIEAQRPINIPDSAEIAEEKGLEDSDVISTDTALDDSDPAQTDDALNDSDVAEAIANLDSKEQEIAITEPGDNMDDYQPQVQVPSAPDYSRAYEALGGADVVNDLRDQFLGMGMNDDAIESVFSKYYPQEYEQEFAQEQFKRGGAVERESPADMARFKKRFAMHKAIGGHVKKMASGGAMLTPTKKTEGFVEEGTKNKSIFDKMHQAVKEMPKVPTSPLGSALNLGYEGYKYFSGKDPVKDFQKELNRKLHPKIDTGSVPVEQFEKFAKGGSSDEPTNREIAEALGELAVTQGKEEYESFKKPRAATDIGNRGILAPALGLPVDMMNMGLSGMDALAGLLGKPTRLSSEKPFAGSEHIKDLMNKYNMTSGEDRPLTETMLSLFSPTGMIKGAQGMTKGAVKAAGAMRKPMSGLGAMREKTN